MRPDQLKIFGFLAALSDDDREALAEVLEERDLLDGKSAFREGDEGEGLILLSEGTLSLKSSRRGDFVGTVDAPYHLGAVSLFSLGKREVTALAAGPCTLWVLPRSGLSRLAEDAPRAAFRLAEATVEELADLARSGIEALVEYGRD